MPAKEMPIFTRTFDLLVWLNFVMRELRCTGYVRYVDDMLLFSDDRAALGRCRHAVVDRLASLRLTMHPGAHVRPVTEGFPFLGFVVSPHRRRLKRRKGIHFARHLRRACDEHARGRRSTAQIAAMVRGWVNHLRHASTFGLRRAVLSTIRLGGQAPGELTPHVGRPER